MLLKRYEAKKEHLIGGEFLSHCTRVFIMGKAAVATISVGRKNLTV